MVGSVAGQRYWSTILPNSAVATCGIWTPDDNQVVKSIYLSNYLVVATCGIWTPDDNQVGVIIILRTKIFPLPVLQM